MGTQEDSVRPGCPSLLRERSSVNMPGNAISRRVPLHAACNLARNAITRVLAVKARSALRHGLQLVQTAHGPQPDGPHLVHLRHALLRHLCRDLAALHVLAQLLLRVRPPPHEVLTHHRGACLGGGAIRLRLLPAAARGGCAGWGRSAGSGLLDVPRGRKRHERPYAGPLRLPARTPVSLLAPSTCSPHVARTL